MDDKGLNHTTAPEPVTPAIEDIAPATENLAAAQAVEKPLKPYVCEVPGCEKSFSNDRERTRHHEALTHDDFFGARKIFWVCPYHGRPYSRHDRLKAHVKEDLDRGDNALGCAKWLDAFLQARGITKKEYFTSKYKGPAPETKFSKTFKGIGYRRDQEDEKWVEREKITETFYVDWSTVFPDSAIDEQPDDACVTERGDADVKDVSIQGAEQRDASDEVPMDVDDSDSSFEPESESESEDEEDEEEVDGDGDEEPIEDNARVSPTHALPRTKEANAIHIKQIIINLNDYQTLFPEAVPITESWLRSAVAARLHGYEFDANRPLTYGDLIDAGLISEIHYVFKDRASSMTDEDWKTPLDRDALFDMRIRDDDAQFFWCPKN